MLTAHDQDLTEGHISPYCCDTWRERALALAEERPANSAGNASRQQPLCIRRGWGTSPACSASLRGSASPRGKPSGTCHWRRTQAQPGSRWHPRLPGLRSPSPWSDALFPSCEPGPSGAGGPSAPSSKKLFTGCWRGRPPNEARRTPVSVQPSPRTPTASRLRCFGTRAQERHDSRANCPKDNKGA